MTPNLPRPSGRASFDSAELSLLTNAIHRNPPLSTDTHRCPLTSNTYPPLSSPLSHLRRPLRSSVLPHSLSPPSAVRPAVRSLPMPLLPVLLSALLEHHLLSSVRPSRFPRLAPRSSSRCRRRPLPVNSTPGHFSSLCWAARSLKARPARSWHNPLGHQRRGISYSRTRTYILHLTLHA